MKSPLSKATVMIAACHLLPGVASALTPVSDNFNSAALKTNRWSLKNYAKGKLTQKSGRLNFTVAKPPTGDDYSILELRNNQPGFNESWQVILDVTNTHNAGYLASPGIRIFNSADQEDSVNLEFYGKKDGFNVICITNDRDDPSGDIMRNPKVKRGSLRISFDKTTKLFTFWYDKTGSANGYQWEQISTFSPTGNGGDRNGNWNMNPGSGRFGIQLFGFAEKQVIAAGKLTMDNFALKAN